jgi:Fe-S-cluster containining protein
MKTYKPSKICAKCGGKCCKRYSGILWPEDIKPLKAETIADMLKSGNYVIDWFEGRNRFLRPKHKNDPYHKGIYEPSWGGECIFLTDTGCTLEWENRPLMCRAVKPSKTEHCDGETGGKKGASDAWEDYQEMLNQAVKMLSKKAKV